MCCSMVASLRVDVLAIPHQSHCRMTIRRGVGANAECQRVVELHFKYLQSYQNLALLLFSFIKIVIMATDMSIGDFQPKGEIAVVLVQEVAWPKKVAQIDDRDISVKGGLSKRCQLLYVKVTSVSVRSQPLTGRMNIALQSPCCT